MVTRKPSTPREKELAVLKLRATNPGLPFEEIAKRVGYKTKAGAQKAYRRALANAGAIETVDEMRTVELHKLALMESKLWPRFNRGELTAGERILAIQRVRARLMGLNQAPKPAAVPERHDHGDTSGVTDLEDFRARREQLRGGLSGG